MELKLSDLEALAKADDGTKMLSINSMEVFRDPTSRERLIEGKMILTSGMLTKEGLEALQKIRKREEVLRKGIPFSQRKPGRMVRMCRDTVEPWVFVKVGKDQVVSNGEMLFIGAPELEMRSTRGSDDLRKALPEIIKKCGKGKFVQVWPHSYQAFSLGGIDLVWLANETQELMAPIQAKYVDFIRGRFPHATYWMSSADMPVLVKVKNRGFKDSVVGIVATFELAGELTVPEKIDQWEVADGKMHREKLPSLGKDDDSSLREGKEE